MGPLELCFHVIKLPVTLITAKNPNKRTLCTRLYKRMNLVCLQLVFENQTGHWFNKILRADLSWIKRKR